MHQLARTVVAVRGLRPGDSHRNCCGDSRYGEAGCSLPGGGGAGCAPARAPPVVLRTAGCSVLGARGSVRGCEGRPP